MTTPRDFRRIFKGIVMNPVAPGRMDTYSPGYLVTAGEQIESLGAADPRPHFPSAGFSDFGNRTIVPGFVDTHVHLPQYAIMGKGDGELLTWLNTYTYPEEARFADSNYAARISAEFFDALVANGTTTASIYSSVHESATDIAFEAARTKGVRAFIGKVMMDRNSPEALQEETGASVSASLRLFDKWDGAENGRLRYVFTPRYAAACSMDLMSRVGEIASECGAFVQTHLAENRDEVEWVRRLFPDCSSYADVYDSAGLLTDRSIMAHCIHLSDAELDVLVKRRVNVAFCPMSNRTLRSGTMPYQRLRDAGLSIALGSDVAGGPTLSMPDQTKAAIADAHILQPEAFYLATLAGAKALGLSEHIGSLDPGKDADFVVLDKDSVHEVYVRGKLVYF